jgi:hypothetical protein
MGASNKIYVVITASLIESNYNTRFAQYMSGISQTIKVFKDIPNVQVVLVENTGITSSFLDTFDIPVLYTNTNNEIVTNNKGIKELVDVFKAIEHFKMKDDDFLIKVTGRYLIHDDSMFIEAIKNLTTTNYNVVLKYGGYNLPEIYREKFYSCITGLVGMRVKYVKTIEMPDEVTCVEWKWADATIPISYDEICILDHLGITQFIGHDNKVIS